MAYVRGTDRDAAFIATCEAAAKSLVDTLVGTVDVPDSAREKAELATGANLYARRASVTELHGYQNGLPQPIPARPALDPLLPARHILAPWLGPGIA